MVYRQYLSACPELRERLLKAEANAKSRRIGFWSQPSPVLPAGFRRGQRAASTPKPDVTGVRFPSVQLRFTQISSKPTYTLILAHQHS